MRLRIFAFAGAFLLGLPAMASPILYTLTGNFTGTLNGTAFTNAVVQLSFASNTTSITGGSGYYLNSTGAATFSVAGVGSGTFTDGTIGTAAQSSSAGFYDTGNAFGWGTSSSTLTGYQLGFLSPVSGTAVNYGMVSEATTRGTLVLAAATGPLTFGAVALTPEPASLTLVAAGLLGIGGALRRRAGTR